MTARKALPALLVALLALAFASPALAQKSKAPTAPTNLRVTAVGDASVSLAWDASRSSASTWWYCVQSSGVGCIRVDPPQTTLTRPAWPGQTYTYTVVALDKNGNRSAPSNAVTVTIPPDTTAPTEPVLSLTSVLPIRASFAWTASKDNVTQVFYTLLVDGSPYFSGLIGALSRTVLYLEPGSTHTYQVLARDSFGNTAESNVVTVTQPAANDATPPGAPGNLRFSSETSVPEIWLDWDAAVDNADAPGQLMYEVFVNGVRVSSAIGYDEDIVYCLDTGSNAIRVRAVDTSGNAGPFSNEIVLIC